MKTRKILFAILLLVLVFVVAAAPAALAQTAGTGGLTGTVTDASSAAVAGATVTATNVGTGQSRTGTTGTDGTYRFGLLPPGTYRVSFSANGFQAVDVPNVVVNVTETASLDRRLEIASQTQQVQVDAQAETDQIQTTSATVGTVIAARTVTDLPLATRNYVNLISLSAGAQSSVLNASTVGRGTTTTAVNGSNINQNNYQMDGATITDWNSGNGFGGGEGGSTGFMVMPNPDTIQEFKIQTSIYDASYGRSSGAAVNVVTRSGTNQFHGSAFEFFRNTVLDANDWFFNRAGLPRYALNQNQFGGTFGGPVRKDKLFFFASVQETRQKNGASSGSSNVILPTIPTGDRTTPAWLDAMYAVYCGSHGVQGGVTIHNPTSGTCVPVPLNTGGVNINPVAINILQLKLPDGSYYIPSGGNNSAVRSYSIPAIFKEHQGLGNVDYVINGTNTLSTRYLYSTDPSVVAFKGTNGLPGFPQSGEFPGTVASVKLTSVLSNSLVNEARMSYQRYGVFHNAHPALFTDTQVGISVLNPNYPDLTSFTLPGFNIGNNYFGFAQLINNQMQWADQISWSHGRHTVRAGYELGYYIRRYSFGLGANIGNVTISSFPDFLIGLPGCTPGNAACTAASPGATNGTTQSNLASNASTIKTGSILDSNGNPTVTNPSNNIADTPVWDNDAFIQDDIKINRHLTINAGLRYQYYPFVSEIQGKLTNEWLSLLRTVPFPSVTTPCTVGGVPGGVPTVFPTPCPGGSFVGYVIPSNYNQALLGPVPSGVLVNLNKGAERSTAPKDNFAPRMGFAWQPFSSGRFVVRGGGGYFFHRLAADDYYIPEARQGPYAAGKQATGPSYYYASLAAPFSQTIGWQPRWFVATGPNAGQNSNLVNQATSEKLKTPLTYEYNLGIQYEFISNWVLELGYVGSHGIDEFTGGAQGGVPYNPAQLASPTNPVNCGYDGVATDCITTSTTTNVSRRVPYLGYAQSVGVNSTSESYRYNSLQATVRKRFSRGFQMQASYTHSESLNTSYLGVNSFYPIKHVNAWDIYYRPDRLTVVYSWDLPFGHPSGILGKVAEGWTISGVTTIQNGLPLTITDSRGGTIFGSPVPSNAQYSATGNAGNSATRGSIQSKLTNYFNKPSFVAPPAATSTFAVGCSGSNCGTLYGNVGNSTVHGPNQNNTDLTVAKTTRVGGLNENATLQFRWEMFNAFNHPQFSNPAAVASSSTFGNITSTAVSSRIMQLALKYVF